MKQQKYYFENDFTVKKVNPSLVIIFGYIVFIISGALLLSLPISHADPKVNINFIDALFTSTSAVCVTGLIVKDTATFFSPFGKFIILLLIQIGGLGYVMISTFFTLAIAKRVDSNIRFQTLQEFQKFSSKEIKSYILKLLLFVFSVELLGSVIMFFRFIQVIENVPDAIFCSIFHSISSFCNAGFSTFSTNLYDFRNDPIIILTVIVLIVLGGIGFIVVRDVYKNRFYYKRFENHSKIVIIMTSLLIVIPFFLFFMFESNSSLKELDIFGKIFNSLFQIVTPRTAGFNTIDFALLNSSSIFLLIILMFIGASPGGTGGGIKTTTFYLVVSYMINNLRGRRNLNIFKRRVDEEMIMKSYFIFTITIFIVVFAILILLVSENDEPFRVIFEVISAYGTVGLSLGGKLPNVSLVANFTPLGKFVIMFVMLIGRVGVLTAVNIFLTKDRRDSFQYPKAKILVG
ncbi:MAG: TrkH family potassium uptake protein [candidate division WOR-3 bacterium]